MKKSFAKMLSFLLLISVLLQGCGVANQPYLKKDASEAKPLKMVRYETPNLRVYTTGGMIGTLVVSGVLFGMVGALFGYVVHYATTIQSDNPELLDFGKLVTDQFVERSKKEIPNWPTMVVQEKAVDKNTPVAADPSTYLIELVVDDIRIEEGSGLGIKTTITMKDMEGNKIWEKGYAYDPILFQRANNLETLKSNNYKKLNDEFTFAAQQTVNDFITHFNNSLPMVTAK